METTNGIEAIRELVGRVLAAWADLDRRFGPAGGLGALAEMHERVRRELELVADAELTEMTAEIRRVVEVLVRMDFELRTVQALKRAFAQGVPPLVPAGE